MTTATKEFPDGLARGMTLHRDVRLAATDVAQDQRTVDLAFASQAPYPRTWGVEILDVSKRAMRLDRLNDAGPLLLDHDPRAIVGVVERARIGSDNVARARVRFGTSRMAREALNDVMDGIRTKVSVGYVIHDLVELGRSDDGMPQYRVTDWEPLEVSLVSIPADTTVGIGRSMKGFSTMPLQDELDNELEQPRLTRAERRAQRENQLTDEQRQNRTLGDLLITARQFAHIYPGAADLAEAVALEGGDDETFRRRLLKAIKDTRGDVTNIGAPSADNLLEGRGYTGALYGDGARTGERYGTLRAFQGKDAEQRAHAVGMYFKAQAGDAGAQRWVQQRGWMQQRVLTTGPGSGSGLVPVEVANEIIRNVEEYGVFRRNARIWPMDSASTEVPVREGGVTVGVVGEEDAVVPSDPSFGGVGLNAKEIAGSTRVSRNVMDDSPVALGDFITTELADAMAKAEDQCGFLADGTSTYAGMSGVITMLQNAAYSGGTVTAASNIDTFAEVTANEIINLMGILPEYARRNAKFYCSSTARDLIFTRLMAAASGNNRETMASAATDRFLGYPIEVSQVLPAGAATDYSAKIMVLFGDLQKASLFGLRRGIDIVVDSSRYVEYRQVLIQATKRFDIVNHGVKKSTTVAGPIVGLLGQ